MILRCVDRPHFDGRLGYFYNTFWLSRMVLLQAYVYITLFLSEAAYYVPGMMRARESYSLEPWAYAAQHEMRYVHYKVIA